MADATVKELVKRVDEESCEREGAPGTHADFDALVRTIWRLRQVDGCPWDREQTHASITRNLIEEAYECAETIQQKDDDHLREELGDLLMQVLLHAQIADDEGAFNIDDVIRELNEKLVRRHPHVFGNVDAGTADEALASWDSVKRTERGGEDEGPAQGLLDSIPSGMPALMQCQKVSVRATKAGFEWETTADVWDKFEEERTEFAAEDRGSADAELEFGDMLFALVNVGRREGIDCERALMRATAKFRDRWSALEKLASERGLAIEDLSTEQLNECWDELKAAE